MSAPYEHIEVDRLAELADDVLPVDEARVVRSHLATCAHCQELFASLLAVPAVLRSSPPPPVPVDVTARVLAAIEREAVARAAEGSSVRSLDAARARPTRRLARVGGGLLATAAALGIGYAVVDGAMVGGGADGPTSGDSSLSSEEMDELADGPAEEPAAGGDTTEDGAIELTSASLETDVRALLDAAPTGAREPSTEVQGEDGEQPPLLTGKPTDACVEIAQERAGTNQAPLAVQVTRYEGEAAVLVVLAEPDASVNTAVDAWVVSATCLSAVPSVSSGGGEIAQDAVDVLVRETVTR